MSERVQLGNEILEFLKTHAKLAADQSDPEVKYNSPDGSEMECVALLLLNEKIPLQSIEIPFSSYNSGGYQPYNDEKAKSWHDELKQKVKKITSK